MCNNNILVITIVTIMMLSSSTSTRASAVEVDIGLVFDELGGKEGEGVFCAIEIGLFKFYETHGRHFGTRLVIHKRDSLNDVVNAADATLDLIENVQVQAILGPQTSMQASFMIELGDKAQVPIISFSASSPTLTSDRKPFFFRATQSDSTEVDAVSAILQAFGWREATAVYIDNDFGRGILPYLNDALQAVNARIVYRCPIPPQASDDVILRELYKLKTMRTRVFILHMSPTLGCRFIRKAQEAGMADKGYVWVMTSGITNSLHGVSSSVFGPMQGALGVRHHVPVTKELQEFKVSWLLKIHQENPRILHPVLDVIALWAHDAAVALAMAVELAATSNSSVDQQKANNIGSSEINSTRVSAIGKNLIRALSEVTFTGLMGNFRFVDGQLPASVYQVVNMHHDGARRVSFWTQETGLIRNLSAKPPIPKVPNSPSSLAPIIWAGESNSVPKGWEIPTSGNKLKVLVPVKQGFLEFVNVSIDPRTNTYVVSGFSIDVFKAVIETLPYPVDYEFIPFAKPNTTDPAGTYDDMVDQVYQGKYDAVVGDVDIRYSRTMHVDFASYMPSTVEMVVPVRDNGAKNAWVFLKPLTWQLWLTITFFFLWIGFVVWVLERRVNDEFLGPTFQQVSTGFWFSFSTMFFTQRERVTRNLTRMVVLVWCFAVLILVQSYTANLTSLLTVQKLEPSVNKLGDLIQNTENVGYEQGSYMEGFLKGLGFKESNLIMFKSAEDLRRLFQLGTRNGGIAAAFDDAPTMKLFMSQYCNEYAVVDPTFQTDGYGFVFPKESPLVSDISRAILELKENGKMSQIEDKWFANEKNCPDSNTSINSAALGVVSFMGLFILAGVASIFALLMSLSFSVRDIDLALDPLAPETPATWGSRVRTALARCSGMGRRSSAITADQPDGGARLMDGGDSVSSTVSTNSIVLDASETDVSTIASPSSTTQMTRRISHQSNM